MKLKGAFVNRRGVIRAGWLLLAAATMYLLADGGVYYLYWYLYRTMMAIWGVTGENVARAPSAVRFLYAWSQVLVQLIQSAAVCGAAGLLQRMDRLAMREEKPIASFGRGADLGAALTAGVWLILLLTGSVRLGWSLSRPAFTVNTLALCLTTLAPALSDGVFVYGALRICLKKRLPQPAVAAVTAAWSVVFLCMNGATAPAVLIGGALSALALLGLAERFGTWSAVGFAFARSYLEQAVFGFAGASAALYETYPVNAYWLNGGNAGVGSGALSMLALAAMAVWLYGGIGALKRGIRRARRKSAS